MWSRIACSELAPPELLPPAKPTTADNPVCFSTGQAFGILNRAYTCTSCGMYFVLAACDTNKQAIALDGPGASTRSETMGAPCGANPRLTEPGYLCKLCKQQAQLAAERIHHSARNACEARVQAGTEADAAE